jgi:hypothetical protein
VHLFPPSLSFLAEAQPRLKNRRGQNALFGRGVSTLHFLGDRTNYKAKDIIGKITNLFCIYLFQIDTFLNFSNMYCQNTRQLELQENKSIWCRGGNKVLL